MLWCCRTSTEVIMLMNRQRKHCSTQNDQTCGFHFSCWFIFISMIVPSFMPNYGTFAPGLSRRLHNQLCKIWVSPSFGCPCSDCLLLAITRSIPWTNPWILIHPGESLAAIIFFAPWRVGLSTCKAGKGWVWNDDSPPGDKTKDWAKPDLRKFLNN